MRSVRLVLAGSLLAATFAVAPGCRDATQVTVAVRAEDAKCSELRGTAITVGSEPAATEENVKIGYVSASTNACTDGTGDIGTLVLTPSDAKRAAVVVVVAYDTSDPTKCPPPDYPGCIVARRSLAFVDHEGLRLPITISPDCLNVPCDAFSTCRHGQCYASAVSCSGGACEEPSVPVEVRTPPPPPPGVPVAPYCAGATLHCHEGGSVSSDVACNAPEKACCTRGGIAQCGGPPTCIGHSRYCCSDADCPGSHCVRPNRVANAPDAGADDGGAVVPDGGVVDLDSGADSGGADAGSGGADAGSGGTDAGSGGAIGLGVCE